MSGWSARARETVAMERPTVLAMSFRVTRAAAMLLPRDDTAKIAQTIAARLHNVLHPEPLVSGMTGQYHRAEWNLCYPVLIQPDIIGAPFCTKVCISASQPTNDIGCDLLLLEASRSI